MMFISHQERIGKALNTPLFLARKILKSSKLNNMHPYHGEIKRQVKAGCQITHLTKTKTYCR